MGIWFKLPPSKARPPTSTNIVRSVTTPCHMQGQDQQEEKQEALEARLLVSTLQPPSFYQCWSFWPQDAEHRSKRLRVHLHPTIGERPSIPATSLAQWNSLGKSVWNNCKDTSEQREYGLSTQNCGWQGCGCLETKDLSHINDALLSAYYGANSLNWLRGVCRLSILSRVRATWIKCGKSVHCLNIWNLVWCCSQ